MSPDPSPEREFYLLGTQQDPALCMALVSCFLGPDAVNPEAAQVAGGGGGGCMALVSCFLGPASPE